MTLKHYTLLISAALLSACTEDPLFGDAPADRGSLIEQGRYLTARSAETPTSEITGDDDIKWFPVGTLYRLLAYTKDYVDESNPDYNKKAERCRFNKVAWEGENGNLRFINVTETPDKWFGFSPMASEGNEQQSIDFYGLTYGKAEERTESYIKLDGIDNENLPADPLDNIKRTENVDDDNKLADLMRGELLNQNIYTAGVDAEANAQSVLPFRHCFSRLHFMTVQQSVDEEVDGKTEKRPVFDGLEIVSVKVTNTYLNGAVYLKDGKVELSGDPAKRELAFSDADNDGDGLRDPLTGPRPVTVNQTELGEMIVYPSAGEVLRNENLSADGYILGLEIKVKCPSAEMRQKFINVDNTITCNPEEDTADAFYMTVKKEQITDYYSKEDKKPLYLMQNTGYTIVLSFQDDAVRIITVIPLVEEWLPGEGTPSDPWQEQPMGQPQMFDNIVWSDRNIGARDYDPKLDFEKTIGYFYQSGRNIPYYPFDTKPYYDSHWNYNHDKPLPKPEDIDKSILADVEKATDSRYRFFPIVDDERILKMHGGNWSPSSAQAAYTWSINTDEGKIPQLYIPEEKPKKENVYFDFVRQNKREYTKENHPLLPEHDMHWELDYRNQPTTGSWQIPTSNDFLSIFPSTPFAGNIAFSRGGWSSDPMSWASGLILADKSTKYDIAENVRTIRVTVPFYSKDPTSISSDPTGRSDKYQQAYNTLKINDDAGCTNLSAYGVGPHKNISTEPDGDPEDGYASVYLISRDGDDETTLPSYLPGEKFVVRSWGTIYAIKRVYTDQAYRMRWRVFYKLYGSSANDSEKTPGMYIEICRYRCNAKARLNDDNYKTDYDWDHPAARIFIPVCGLGDWSGQYINFGTECQYATSDPIGAWGSGHDGGTGAVQIKITGDSYYNVYIAVIKNVINRTFGKQIRPIYKGG